MRAVNAARPGPTPRAITKETLRAEAESTALNALALLRETWEDFRRSDRFFKYKAAILIGWMALSAMSVGIACPTSSSRLGATLVAVPQTSPTIYMVKNGSEQTWNGVVIVVNGQYRTAVAALEANDGLTLSPRILATADGKPAPSPLVVTDLEVITSNTSITLMSKGKPR